MVLILTSVGLSGSAWAAPGDHIRTGDAELVPDLDLGAEYRTNVYRSEADAVPAANLRISPGLTATVAGDDHHFQLGSEWILRKYIFRGGEDSTGRVVDLDRFDEFNVGASADTFKRNLVGFQLSDTVALQNWRADAEFAEIPYTSQLRNALAGGVRVNPGPALTVTPGGRWTYDSYRVPSPDGEADRQLNARNSFGPTLAAKWAFLPRTALVANAEYIYDDWQVNLLESNDAEAYGAFLGRPNSSQARAYGGIDGRFTERVFAELKLGYGVARFQQDRVEGGTAELDEFAVDASGLDGFLVATQVRYTLTPSAQTRRGNTVGVGYTKDFRPSFFTNYVALNQIFADYQGRVGSVEPSVRYELRYESYKGEIARQDVVNRATADLRLLASDWVSFTTGAWWQRRSSTDDNVEYDDFNLHLLTTLTY